MKKILIIISAFLLSSVVSFADYAISNYRSLKSNSMGGASVLADVNESALISNPAMLNMVTNTEFILMGIEASVGDKAVDTAEGIYSLIDETGEDNLGDDQIAKILKAYLEGNSVVIDGKTYNSDKYKLENKEIAMNINIAMLSFVRKNFGFGVLTNVNISDLVLVDKPSSPELNINAEFNVQAPVGFSMAFGSNKNFILGASIRYIEGAKMNSSLTATDFSRLSDDDLEDNEEKGIMGTEQYTGYGVSIGTIYKSSYLNYSLSFKDVLSGITVTNYDIDGYTKDTDETLPLNLSFAISNKYNPEERGENWFSKNVFWTAEFSNLLSKDLDGNGYDDDNMWKKLHLGTDISLVDRASFKLNLRAGLNQGYPTFGFGTDMFGFLVLEYANYTIEKGPHLGMKEENYNAISFKISF